MTPRRPGGRAYGPGVGARIRAIRHARGLTIKQLAAAAGVSFPFLSHIETGVRGPSHRSLLLLSAALGLSDLHLISFALFCFKKKN